METMKNVGGEQGAAMALVQQGATLMRIENDSMLAVAVQRPRDEAAVLKGALSELELYPELAHLCFYSIPYKDRGKTIYVTGPSIDAAMGLARRWGNCSTGARILSEDDDRVQLEGVFLDLETNFRVTRPHSATRMQRLKDGRVVIRTPEQLLQAIGASASKAMRNAILKGLPAGLVRAYYQRARAIAGGEPDKPAEAERVKKLMAFFERYKVTPAMVEAKVGKPVKAWLGTDVANMRGIANAIMDGQVEVDEVFGGNGTPAVEPEAVDLTTGEITVESDAKREPSKPAEPKPATKKEPAPAAAETKGDAKVDKARALFDE